VLNNRTGDVTAWAREVTGGRGVDVVFDHVGTALFAPSIFSLAIGGRLVCCGNTSGDAATIPSLGFLFHSGAKIVGSDPYWPEEFGPRGRSSSTLGFPPPSTQSSHSPMLPPRSSDWNPVTCSARSSCVHDRDLDRRRAIPRVEKIHTMARTGRPFADRNPPVAAPVWSSTGQAFPTAPSYPSGDHVLPGTTWSPSCAWHNVVKRCSLMAALG